MGERNGHPAGRDRPRRRPSRARAPGLRPAAPSLAVAVAVLGTAAGWTDGTVGPVSVPLAADLRVSLATVGLLSGTLFFGACLVAAWTTPWATNRLGVTWGLRVGCGLDVAGNLLSALGPSFAWLAVGRVLVGLGVGAVFVLAYVLAREQGGVRLMGILGGSTSLGLALSLVVGGLIADIPAWRASFAITGALGVVALLLVPTIDLTDRPSPIGRILPLLGRLLRPGTWLVLGVYLAATCTPLVLGVWIVVYLSADPGGLSPWLAGLFGGLLYFITVLTRPIGGLAGHRSANRWWLPALGLALAGGGLAGLALSRSLGPVIVSVAAIGAGFALPFATVVDWVAVALADEPATSLALAQTVGSAVPMAAIPAVGAALHAGAGAAAMGALAAVSLAGALGSARLRRAPAAAGPEPAG